jgi:hypothetical protein
VGARDTARSEKDTPLNEQKEGRLNSAPPETCERKGIEPVVAGLERIGRNTGTGIFFFGLAYETFVLDQEEEWREKGEEDEDLEGLSLAMMEEGYHDTGQGNE